MNAKADAQEKRSPDFTLAFKQMASVVAIAKTRATASVLDELVQQCFVILPSDPLSTPEQITAAIKALFGMTLHAKDVELSLERLKRAGLVVGIGSGRLSLASATQTLLTERVAAATSLEQDVRSLWLNQVHSFAPSLAGDRLWTALRSYLAQAFRRHGIQAVEMLEPSVSLSNGNQSGLSSVLDSVVANAFETRERVPAREAIESFFVTVESDRKRAEYIAALADGAFNYFSLAMAPEVSETLRGKLMELRLFLDTNFLFGILDLHVNSQVDVSSELIEVIRRFKLPFRLRYHEATAREMTNTLHFFSKELSKQEWTQKISRAVVASDSMSGIEFRYHSKNAEQPVAVDDFLAPLQHWQILLKDKGIDIHRADSLPPRLQARADLEADYRDYLEKSKLRKEKSDDAIQHDMTVLEAVRSLRTNARNTLEAGHLLVTCDYHLFRFDCEQSRRAQRPHSTVLPNLLWQILRPFVTDSADFDRAFAETFALPEFTLGRGSAQRAAAKMASILSGYSDLPEVTATKMLANDLLLAQLSTKKTEREFADAVESAMATENAQLMEDRASLASQLEKEKRDHEAAVDALKIGELALAEKERLLRERQDAVETLRAENVANTLAVEKAAREAREAQKKSGDAERFAAEQKSAVERAEARTVRNAKLASSAIAILGVAIFELTVRFVYPWTWLLKHPNSYGLQACAGLMLGFGIVGLAVKSWRNWLWAVGVFGLLSMILQMLGGSTPPTQ